MRYTNVRVHACMLYERKHLNSLDVYRYFNFTNGAGTTVMIKLKQESSQLSGLKELRDYTRIGKKRFLDTFESPTKFPRNVSFTEIKRSTRRRQMSSLFWYQIYRKSMKNYSIPIIVTKTGIFVLKNCKYNYKPFDCITWNVGEGDL